MNSSKVSFLICNETENPSIIFIITDLIQSSFLDRFNYLQRQCFGSQNPPMGEEVCMGLYVLNPYPSISADFSRIGTTSFYISGQIPATEFYINQSNAFRFLFPGYNFSDIIGSVNFKLSLNIKDTLLDIFDVCSQFPRSRDSQNRTPSEVLFKRVLIALCAYYNKNLKFSLGVDFTNPVYAAAVKLYLKCGFTDPKMQTKLNIDSFTRAVPFLKLDTDCYIAFEGITELLGMKLIENKEVIDRDLEKAMYLKNEFNKQIATPYIVQIYISREMDNYLKTMLYRQYETSGSFVLVKDASNKYFLSFVCESEQFGTNNAVFMKHSSPITMHTHPDICLQINNCVYSWPSGGDWDADFHMIINYSFKQLAPCFIVYSSLGYYITQPTDMLHKVIQYGDPDLVKFVYITILLIVSEFEDFRKSGPPKDNLKGVYFYMNILNLISIEYLLERTKILLQKFLTHLDTNNIQMSDYFANLLTLYSQRKEYFEKFYNINPKYIHDLFKLIDPDAYQPANIKNTRDFINDMINSNGGDWLNYIESIVPSNMLKEPLIICHFVDELVKDSTKAETSFYFYNYPTGVNLQDNSTLELDHTIPYIFGSRTCNTVQDIIS